VTDCAEVMLALGSTDLANCAQVITGTAAPEARNTPTLAVALAPVAELGVDIAATTQAPTSTTRDRTETIIGLSDIPSSKPTIAFPCMNVRRVVTSTCS
jgi:hypothetical protein